MKKLSLSLAGILIFLGSSSLFAGPTDVVGVWTTIDDKTGKPKSKVELFESGGKLYGKIKELINPDEPNPKCTKCKGALLNQPVIGMQIVNGLSKTADGWEGGTILDPNNGETYKCKIWNEGGKLKLRGYIGFLFRTQTWVK